MRVLLTIGLVLCFLPATAPRTIAQYPASEWIDVSPAGEEFHVSLPFQPRTEIESAEGVSGNRYTAITAEATYTIWSIKKSDFKLAADSDTYLDGAAELLWERLLKSAREQLDEKTRQQARITYVRDLASPGKGAALAPDARGFPGLPGREYTLTVGEVTGTADLFVAHEQLFVMLALGKAGGDWPREKFFSSFRVPETVLNAHFRNLIAPPVDPSQDEVFSGRDVTKKVHLLAKAEPTYTESARKFGVQGTVVLRGVFSKNGDVIRLQAMTKLPHGLTERAISAARNIRFEPAMKDGLPVSQWMEMQYTFHLY